MHKDIANTFQRNMKAKKKIFKIHSPDKTGIGIFKHKLDKLQFDKER